MVLRFRDDSPNLLDYVCCASVENPEVIGDGTINHVLSEAIFSKLKPLPNGTKRCVIVLADLKDFAVEILEREEDDDEPWEDLVPEQFEQLMGYTASIVPEIQDIVGYIEADTNPLDVDSWQLLILLYIGGSLLGKGEIQTYAQWELMNVLSGYYGVYQTDTLILFRLRAEQPILIYPWNKENKVIVH